MANKRATDRSQKPAQQHYSLLNDIWKGAVQGENAQSLGLVGALTRIVMGFIPVFGTVCAVRDYFACRRKHDKLGAAINILAIIPIAGGFPEVVETIRDMILTMEMLHSGAHFFRRIAISNDATDWSKHAQGGVNPELIEDYRRNSSMYAEEDSHTVDGEPHAPIESSSKHGTALPQVASVDEVRNGLALFSLCSGLLTPILLLLGIGVLLPPITVVTGHLAMRRARRLAGSRYARLFMSRMALLIGYIELISFGLLAVVAALALYTARSRIRL